MGFYVSIERGRMTNPEITIFATLYRECASSCTEIPFQKILYWKLQQEPVLVRIGVLDLDVIQFANRVGNR